MRKKLAIGIGLAFITMVGLLYILNKPNDSFAEYKDVKQLVEAISTDQITGIDASITSEEVVIIDENGKETTYDLPEDEFFVSIAPFQNVTHPCAIHSLTGCQGELVEKEFEVLVVDEFGNVVLDDTLHSYANGFIDLWLPRDQVFHVTITYGEQTAVSLISTFKNDNTCITTMKLN